MSNSFSHTSVLLNECIALLNPGDGGVFVDATLGGGGHTERLLERGAGRVIGIDKDMQAIRAASARLGHYGERFTAVHGDFRELQELIGEQAALGVDGVLMDLGVSSPQLDEPARGFSYHADAPLDMRMDQSAELTAETVVNTYELSELRRILWEYGEEKWGERIARFIIDARPLHTTQELVRVIDRAVPKGVRTRYDTHPARRTFQALRIEVNGELAILEDALSGALDCLKPGGRLAVITFHSLEDRIVKRTFQTFENPCTCPRDFPVCVCGKKPTARILTKKPIAAGETELAANVRARSAKLRAVQKL
jgi:16S rRNA (cytosine1402-N4)-methyltransferase